MEIRIGHLYPDLMNLYGEIGNIKVLDFQLKKQGLNPIVSQKSLGDAIDFADFDLIYLGCGTENNRYLVLEDLLSYRKTIDEQINKGQFFLISGNALALFGQSIRNHANRQALGIFPFYELLQEKRVVKEIIYNEDFIGEEIYGIVNKQGLLYQQNNLKDDKFVVKNNFYGTTLLGPVLVKNPQFLEYFLRKLISFKYPDFQFKHFDLHLEEEAYQEFKEFKAHKKIIKE